MYTECRAYHHGEPTEMTEKLRPENFDVLCDWQCNNATRRCTSIAEAVGKHPKLREYLDGRLYDKLGRRIEAGAFIVYGNARGRCAGLRLGKVLAVGFSTAEDCAGGIRITVQGVADDWSHKEIKLASRTGTLLFPERIIVLDAAEAPLVYAKLLYEA